MPTAPQTWKLTLAYDGTDFHGWQIQPALPTIQQTLARALHLLTGESVLPQASGRTDAGVHALAQVASFQLATAIPPPNLIRALNGALPPSIRILTAEHAPQGFHARHSARSKTYQYRIALTDPSPFQARYQWHCTYPLNLALMNQAAQQIIGIKDFTSFAASDPDLSERTAASHAATNLSSRPERSGAEGPAFKPSAATDAQGNTRPTTATSHPLPKSVIPTEAEEPAFKLGSATDTQGNTHSTTATSHPLSKSVIPTEAEGPAFKPSTATTPEGNTRTITTSLWTQQENELRYEVTGTGFLHHMVRNLVGTFVDVGRAHTTPEQFAKILNAKNRTAAGPTAPPQGLFLVSVDY